MHAAARFPPSPGTSQVTQRQQQQHPVCGSPWPAWILPRSNVVAPPNQQALQAPATTDTVPYVLVKAICPDRCDNATHTHTHAQPGGRPGPCTTRQLARESGRQWPATRRDATMAASTTWHHMASIKAQAAPAAVVTDTAVCWPAWPDRAVRVQCPAAARHGLDVHMASSLCVVPSVWQCRIKLVKCRISPCNPAVSTSVLTCMIWSAHKRCALHQDTQTVTTQQPTMTTRM